MSAARLATEKTERRQSRRNTASTITNYEVNMNQLISSTDPITMTSREIAELTGKLHKHVKRDAEEMFKQLGLSDEGYAHSWTHPQNRQSYTEYVLPKDLTLTLVSGYNAKLRYAITKRWMELESQQSPQIPQSKREWIELALEQEKQLEQQQAKIEQDAPKVAFVDNLADRTNLMNATQVAQEHGKSAIWLTRYYQN